MGIARRAFGTVGRQAAFVGVEGIGAWALNERVHRFTPMGDGHTVLLDHGLFSGAHHVKGLAEGLLRKNFNVVVMPGTFNTSFGTEKIVAHRVREIKKAYDKTGPVSLGGESAGGINWMLAAHEVPHMVRTINLFGTPIELDAEGPVLEGLLWVYG